MAKKIQGGMSPYLAPLQARRDKLQAPTATKPLGTPEPVERSRVASDLKALGAPASILEEHGAHLKDVGHDLAAIQTLKTRLRPHQQKQLTLAEKKLWGLVGAQLELAPFDHRKSVATQMVRDFHHLVVRSGTGASAIPLVYATLGLVDAGVRHQAKQRLTLTPEEMRTSIGDAHAAGEALICTLYGRTGIASALNVYSNLVEQLELTEPKLSQAKRRALWSSAATYLEEAGDRRGFTSQSISDLAEALSKALAAKAGDPLAEARKDRVREPTPAGANALEERLAETACAKEAIAVLPHFQLPEAAIQRAARASAADLPRVLLELFSAAIALPVDRTLAGKISTLPAPIALNVVIACARYLGTPGALESTYELARRAPADASIDQLAGFTARYGEVFQNLAANDQLAGEASGVALEIAKLANETIVPQFPALLAAAEGVKKAVRGAAISDLLASTLDGGPGLVELVDPKSDFRNAPLPHLAKLLGASCPKEQVRAAMAIAANLGRVGLDAGRYVERVVEDFRFAVDHPELLKFSPRSMNAVSVRADRSPSLALFLKEHPQLPAEIAPTVARFCTPEQIAWLSDKLSANTRSLDTARTLRDFVLGAIEGNRPELIEAARTSPSTPKVMRRVVAHVAQAFRLGQLGDVRFDVLVEGLKAGRDPLADLARARDAGQLSVDLYALTGGRVDEKGRAELLATSHRINELLKILVAGGPAADRDVKMEEFRPVFLDVLRSVANGTWPAPKYENAIGQRIMGGLSLGQGEIWKNALITPAVDPGARTTNVHVEDALLLLAGLQVAMPEAIALGGPHVPAIGWDRASLDNLLAMRGFLIEEMRLHPKGSEEHARSAKRIGPVQEDIALLELHHALEATSGEKDPAKLIPRVRPALLAAASVLKKRGGDGFAETVDQIAFATQDIKASARAGKYAVDEDSFTALATANTSGCLSPNWSGGPGRQWGLVGALADANIRMLRVMDGDKQVYRGFLKFFHADFPGYSGPVLWGDPPQPDGGGSAADKLLWYRHAIRKAQAMGVPLTFGNQSINGTYFDPAWLRKLAEEMGSTVHTDSSIRVYLDEGNTGFMHSDTLVSGKGNIRAGRGNHPTWNVDTKAFVVMPR